MSPGGANPLTSPAGFELLPRLDEALVLLVEPEELLVLDALDHAEHAPGHVIVDRRHLAGAPDEADDGEAPVGLDVEHVAAVTVRIADPLLGGEDAGRGQVAAQIVRHQLGGAPPVSVELDRGADRVHQLVQLRRRNGAALVRQAARSAAHRLRRKSCTLDAEAAENLRALGRRVPDDVAVIGFDDVADAASTNPPLTTVRQPLEAITQALAELLLRRIEDASVEGEFVVCPTRLIRRASA